MVLGIAFYIPTYAKFQEESQRSNSDVTGPYFSPYFLRILHRVDIRLPPVMEFRCSGMKAPNRQKRRLSR
ncbi:hypothetical protein J6590_070231 [Homalodisca vitripennis]|nr:hypothetical protein J6590_070231 [Homalodisca vitripennis]